MILAGPFPLELWEVLGSISNSFSFTAVHNQTPHWYSEQNPVSVDGIQ